MKDRLYLVEECDYRNDEEGNIINPLQGRRIVVLSLQGDTLQVYTHLVEGQIFIALCCFDGKLLATIQDDETGGVDDGDETGGVEVMALRGV